MSPVETSLSFVVSESIVSRITSKLENGTVSHQDVKDLDSSLYEIKLEIITNKAKNIDISQLKTKVSELEHLKTLVVNRLCSNLQ